MAISKRLKAIAKYIEGFDSLADIACDHGYLGIYAVQKYKLSKALLTDINPMPLASAEKNIKNSNLESVIKTKLGNGLQPLTDEYDVICICGIGGMLLKEILSKDLDKCIKAKRLILCPNTDLYEVRKFLNDNGFIIEIEEMVCDYKYYEIVIASYIGKNSNYSELQLKYGPKLLEDKSDVFISYYKSQLEIYNRQLQFISDNNAKEKIMIKIKEINTILGNNL